MSQTEAADLMSSDKELDDLLASGTPLALTEEQMNNMLADLMQAPEDQIIEKLVPDETEAELLDWEEKVLGLKRQLLNKQTQPSPSRLRLKAAEERLEQQEFELVQVQVRVREKSQRLKELVDGIEECFMGEEVLYTVTAMRTAITMQKTMDQLLVQVKKDGANLVSRSCSQMVDMAVQTEEVVEDAEPAAAPPDPEPRAVAEE